MSDYVPTEKGLSRVRSGVANYIGRHYPAIPAHARHVMARDIVATARPLATSQRDLMRRAIFLANAGMSIRDNPNGAVA